MARLLDDQANRAEQRQENDDQDHQRQGADTKPAEQIDIGIHIGIDMRVDAEVPAQTNRLHRADQQHQDQRRHKDDAFRRTQNRELGLSPVDADI